jgi:hypothetical protein
MRRPSPPKNVSETQETEKAPFLVVKRIREAILDDVFLPGDRLTEAELVEKFGVSRSPVRELARTPGDSLILREERVVGANGCRRHRTFFLAQRWFLQRALSIRQHRSSTFKGATNSVFFNDKENNENTLTAPLIGLAIGFAVPTFAQQTNTPDPEPRQVVGAQGAHALNPILNARTGGTTCRR